MNEPLGWQQWRNMQGVTMHEYEAAREVWRGRRLVAVTICAALIYLPAIALLIWGGK